MLIQSFSNSVLNMRYNSDVVFLWILNFNTIVSWVKLFACKSLPKVTNSKGLFQSRIFSSVQPEHSYYVNLVLITGLATIEEVRVSGCTQRPCRLKKGANTTIEFDFKTGILPFANFAKNYMKNVRAKILKLYALHKQQPTKQKYTSKSISSYAFKSSQICTYRQKGWKTNNQCVRRYRHNPRPISRRERSERVQRYSSETRWKKRMPTWSKWSLHLFKYLPDSQDLPFGMLFSFSSELPLLKIIFSFPKWGTQYIVE